MSRFISRLFRRLRRFNHDNNVFFHAITIGKTKPDRFPAYYDEDLVLLYFKKLNTIDERIAYLDILLNTLNKIKSLSSDEEIKSFLIKYKLQYHLIPYSFDLNKVIPEIHKELKFVSKNYGGFQQRILREISLLSRVRKEYVALNNLLNSDFKMVFTKDDFLSVYNSFNDENERLQWLEKLIRLLFEAAYMRDDGANDIIFEKYGLNNIFHADKKTFKGFVAHFNLLHRKYESYRFYIRSDFIHFVIEYSKDLLLKKNIADSLIKYPDKFESVYDKFPVYNFDYKKIMEHCNAVFKKTNEKIEYISHVMLEHNLFEKSYSSSKEFKENLELLDIELTHLKTVFDLEIKNSPVSSEIISDLKNLIDVSAKSSTPISFQSKSQLKKDHSQLVKHYFKIAMGVYGVPKVIDLAEGNYSTSFWSKKLSDPLFLVHLFKAVEKKMESKIITPENKEVYIKINLDVKERINRSQISERKKDAEKYGKDKNVDDSFADTGSYDDNYNDPDNY